MNTHIPGKSSPQFRNRLQALESRVHVARVAIVLQPQREQKLVGVNRQTNKQTNNEMYNPIDTTLTPLPP